MKITIEIYTANNSNVIFQPTAETYRGHWSNAKIPGQEMRPAIRAMPEIPGIHLEVNTEARTCRSYDPLASDASRWAQIERIQRENAIHLDPNAKPWPEKVFQADDDMLKTWIFWFWKLVDAGNARVVEGQIPEMKEILEMPGTAVVGQFNSSISRQLTAEKDSVYGRLHASKRVPAGVGSGPTNGGGKKG